MNIEMKNERNYVQRKSFLSIFRKPQNGVNNRNKKTQ